MEPLYWNTLSEAAKWLSEKLKEEWDEKRILSYYCTHTKGSRIAAKLPKETKFGLYRFDLGVGFVRIRDISYRTVWLWPVHASDLLLHGETTVSIATRDEDRHLLGLSNGEMINHAPNSLNKDNTTIDLAKDIQKDRIHIGTGFTEGSDLQVFIEPLESKYVVTVNDVGINAMALEELAVSINKIKGCIKKTETQQEKDKNSYTTKLLETLHEATQNFWDNYDPNRPPKSDVVVAWLENKGVSKRIAGAMDTIMRSENAKKGGNKRVLPG